MNIFKSGLATTSTEANRSSSLIEANFYKYDSLAAIFNTFSSLALSLIRHRRNCTDSIPARPISCVVVLVDLLPWIVTGSELCSLQKG